jgi:hypothetical protein
MHTGARSLWPMHNYAEGTWRKTTTQSWGLAMRKESPNGGVERRQAGDEGMVAAHHCIGFIGEKEEASAGDSFYRWRRERGDDRGPTGQRQLADDLPARRRCSTCQVPLS